VVGVTVSELAASAGVSVKKMSALLDDFERAGVAERIGDNWRLTPTGDHRFGRALRASRPIGGVPVEPDDLRLFLPGPQKVAA
jgi:hypothetical protein